MNVFFDHQTFSLQTFGGISRYYSELITGINQTNDNRAYLSLLLSNNTHLKESGLAKNNLLPESNFYKKAQITYRTNQAYTIAQLHKKSFDIFHATYYDPYFIPYLKGRPFTITFLDMIHEKFSDQFSTFPDSQLVTKQKKTIADRADRIIAISESTKRDIVELLNIDPAKIDVTYLGSSLQPAVDYVIEKKIDSPYLLFVGRRERYKNFEGLVRAIDPLLKKYKLKLIAAGGGPFSREEKELIHSLNLDELVEQRAIINDSTLQEFYLQAVAFIFPTMYEGFGIPILEAFACDCPCIISNLSSLPEVGGNAALYINPKVADSISHAVEQLIQDSKLRCTLIERGREQLKRFSWQRTVIDTLNSYKVVL